MAAPTIGKLISVVSTVTKLAPTGTIEQQRRDLPAFNRELRELRREMADACRPLVVAFIDRWKAQHK